MDTTVARIEPMGDSTPVRPYPKPGSADEQRVVDEALSEVRTLLVEEELKKARLLNVRPLVTLMVVQHTIQIEPLDPAVVDAAHAELSRGLSSLAPGSPARERLTRLALSIVHEFADRPKPKRAIRIRVPYNPSTKIYLAEYQADEVSDFIDKYGNVRLTVGSGPGATIIREGYFGDDARKWVTERYSHILETLSAETPSGPDR